MFQPVDRAGIFKGRIESFGLKQMESGSVAITIRALLTECWSGEGWDPWEQYGMEASGDLWIVKKNGEINSPQVESLIKFAGWDGNLESVNNDAWKPTPCQFVIGADEYKGQTRYRIDFLNELDRTPGGVGNVDASKAKELQTKYGAQLRAIAGNAKRNGSAAPTATRPAAPPPAPAKATVPAGQPTGFEPIPQ